MSNDSSSGNQLVGLVSLLGVAFVVLKLIGTITWSWWWVTMPFWGGIALVIIVVLVLYVIKLVSK